MNDAPNDFRDLAAAHVIGYTRTVIAQADDRIGHIARKQMLQHCDRQVEMCRALRSEFAMPLQHPNPPLLWSSASISALRAKTLRQAADAAKSEHEQVVKQFRNGSQVLLPYETQIRFSAAQRSFADNPNAFKTMAKFLIMVALVNHEHAGVNLEIDPDTAVLVAQQRLREQWNLRVRAHRHAQPRLPHP